MRPCDKCLENNWTFKKEEDWIFATCICGHEVEWQVKPKRELQVGDPCRKCKAPLVLKELKMKPKKLEKLYYFTHVLKCLKCKVMFFQERYKEWNKK